MANTPALEANFNNNISDIEAFTVNGEMAGVTWYKKGNVEVNGKYVERIEYIDTN